MRLGLNGLTLGGGAVATTPVTPIVEQPLLKNAVAQQLFKKRAFVGSDGATYIPSQTGFPSAALGGFKQSFLRLTKISDREPKTWAVAPPRNVTDDDHNLQSALELPGGKVVQFWGDHGGSASWYRVSRQTIGSAAGLDGGWAAIKQLPLPPSCTGMTYGHAWVGTDGYFRIITRTSGVGGWYLFKCLASDLAAGTETWSYYQCFSNDPYFSEILSDDGNTVWFISVSGNAASSNTVDGFKCSLSGGNETWTTWSGGALTAPFNTNTGTRVRDSTNGSNIALDCRLGDDGYPRIILAQSASFTTGPAPITNLRYTHGRWNGTTTLLFDLATNEPGFSDAVTQIGSASFDGVDPTVIYISLRSGSFNEIFELQINETTQTITSTTARSSGSSYHQSRPFSPEGRTDDCRVFWMEIINFTGFSGQVDTNFRCYGKQFYTTLPEPVSYDSTATSIINAITSAASAPTQNEKVWINRIVTALKAGTISSLDVWTTYARMFGVPAIFADEARARYDWKWGSSLTKTGSPTFTSGQGFKGTTDGTTDHYQGPALNSLSGYGVNSWWNAGHVGRVPALASGYANVSRWPSGTGGNAIQLVFNGTIQGCRVSNVNMGSGDATWPAGYGFQAIAMWAAANQRAYRENNVWKTGTTAAGSAQSAAIAIASQSRDAFVHFYANGVCPATAAATDAMMEDIQIAVEKAIYWIGSL